ncbi:hypothetical protein [Roseiflexus castenholzii]|uniref:hypothetical protein n=1 Tax=Roseiflexus castenholzii TaxID=120962 RepID=UPI003C79F846
MASAESLQIDEVVAAVLAAPKYRMIAPSLVRTLAMRELAARRNVKAAIKATKNKLHQIVGAYAEPRIDVAEWVRQLQTHEVPPAQPSRKMRSFRRRWQTRMALILGRRSSAPRSI